MIELQHHFQETSEGTFTKGMTLQEYMTKLSFANPENECRQFEEKQQNLYESILVRKSQARQATGLNCLIEQVDQQSVDESHEGRNDEFNKEDLKDQLTKQTFRNGEEIKKTQFGKKKNQEKLRNTAYFNQPSHQPKNHYRLRHISNSPARKKNEHLNSPFNGALTLYGKKFGASNQKEGKKMQELVTFYGKISREKSCNERSLDLKKGSSKRNFKNRGHLELNELIGLETKIKNNFSQKIYLKDLRVQGLKDKLAERKNKFC